MKKSVLSLLLLIVLNFIGCSTDFDMYAPYKDISIVYCVADFSDDTTWVKITKAYYGPDNVLESRHEPDSNNYPYMLDAYFITVLNVSTPDTIKLDTVTIHNKDVADTIINNGDTVFLNQFYAPDQLMYFTDRKLTKGSEYKLNIKKNTGETVSAASIVVSDFQITKPDDLLVFANNKKIILNGSVQNRDLDIG